MTKNIETEKRIGTTVRLRRLTLGLTQEELGAKIGVSYQQIQKYETGANRIAVSTLMKIAEAFGTTATLLITEIEKER